MAWARPRRGPQPRPHRNLVTAASPPLSLRCPCAPLSAPLPCNQSHPALLLRQPHLRMACTASGLVPQLNFCTYSSVFCTSGCGWNVGFSSRRCRIYSVRIVATSELLMTAACSNTAHGKRGRAKFTACHALCMRLCRTCPWRPHAPSPTSGAPWLPPAANKAPLKLFVLKPPLVAAWDYLLVQLQKLIL